MQYPAMLLASLGVERLFVVVSGIYLSMAERVLSPLDDLFDIDYIVNDRPSWENGYSFALAARRTAGPLLLTMADHLMSLEVAAKALPLKGDLTVVGDARPRYVDVEEATKILATGDRVLRIGKNLTHFTHVDTGFFSVGRRFVEFVRSVPEGRMSLSDLIRMAIDAGLDVRLAEVSGGCWTDIDTPEDLLKLLKGSRREVLERVSDELFPH